MQNWRVGGGGVHPFSGNPRQISPRLKKEKEKKHGLTLLQQDLHHRLHFIRRLHRQKRPQGARQKHALVPKRRQQGRQLLGLLEDMAVGQKCVPKMELW